MASLIMDDTKVIDPAAPIEPQEEQIVPETPAVPEDPGYKYEDLKAPIRDIASNTEEPKPEEPEPPKGPEAPETLTEEEIPVEKVIEDTTRKVLEEQESKRQADEQAKIEAEAKPADPKAEYQQIVDAFQAKEGRVPTWDELAVKIEERTIQRVEAKQQEAETAKQAEIAKAKADLEQTNKQIDTLIQDELSDLYRANQLTPVKDANNPSDQGVVEKNALLNAWKEVNIARRAKGLPDVLSAARIFYGTDEQGKPYFTKPNAQLPGADAPIAGNKGSAVSPNEQQYTNADLKAPWSFFRKKL